MVGCATSFSQLTSRNSYEWRGLWLSQRISKLGYQEESEVYAMTALGRSSRGDRDEDAHNIPKYIYSVSTKYMLYIGIYRLV